MQIKSNLSHIMNCKKKLVQRILLFFDMFLPRKFAFYMPNKIGGVSSYFFCYRAMSERVRFLLFYDMKRQCCYLCFPIVVATKEGKSFC